jgi:hypothetical protein
MSGPLKTIQKRPGSRWMPGGTAAAGAGLTLLVGALLLLAQGAQAGLPQPMCVYYGQARDGYGLPYTTNADVILLQGTNEVARHTIRGSLTPGVNFALYAHIDDGRTTVPYSRRAVRSGDLVNVVVRDSSGQRTIMEAQTVPPVGKPGELIAINATAGTDLDGDGIPDLWELELIAWSGGTLRTIYDVRGEDDWDGDGMTNLQEYKAGTFAFLDYDYFMIEWCEPTPNLRLRLVFLSVPGMAYSVRSAVDLKQPVWDPWPFSITDDGVPGSLAAEGNGDWMSLYVPVQQPGRYYQLEVR